MKKSLILIMVLFLLNGIFIKGYEEECIGDYAIVNGTKAEITSCNVIETREGDPLYIEFIKCPEIKFPITYNSYDNKDGRLKIDRYLEIYPIKSNYLRFSNFKTLTYIPILRCYDKGVFKKAYEPHIKVYPPRDFPEIPITSTTTTTIKEEPKPATTTTIKEGQNPLTANIIINIFDIENLNLGITFTLIGLAGISLSIYLLFLKKSKK